MAVMIEISIPTEIVGDVVDAFAWRHNYDRNKELISGTIGSDVDPPVYETEVAFAKRRVRLMIVSTYVSYMEEVASRGAGAAASVTASTAAEAVVVQ